MPREHSLFVMLSPLHASMPSGKLNGVYENGHKSLKSPQTFALCPKDLSLGKQPPSRERCREEQLPKPAADPGQILLLPCEGQRNCPSPREREIHAQIQSCWEEPWGTSPVGKVGQLECSGCSR